ncbi:hypothetical protein V2G26_000543 [Clonostachys chloroleuca]
MSESSETQPGGFIRPWQGTGLASPAPSTASSQHGLSLLPHPRGKSLQPGSNKEDMVRRYVEDKLLHTSRRYVKKFGDPDVGDSVVGYKSFSEVCRDLDGVVNVLWLSGTPGLQIPFLLKLASDFTQYVRSFPASPRASFEILGKLDHCFSSLLTGQDIISKEPLPGFENGLRAGMSTTDMVRCRSLVEQTRVLMVEVMSNGEDIEEEDDDDDEKGEHDTTDDDLDQSRVSDSGIYTASWNIDDDRLHLDAARIYEHTIVQLGERLGDPLAARNMSEN